MTGHCPWSSKAQAALPMAAVWGTGRTASSDGQFFPAAGRGEAREVAFPLLLPVARKRAFLTGIDRSH